MGALFGDTVHLIEPSSGSQLAAYAVVGMGGFLAATTHAPLTSILLIFEMTLDYEVVLPLMLACVTGHYVARIYRGGESVYTHSLSSKGPGDEDEWRLRQITALIRPPASLLQRDQPFGAALEEARDPPPPMLTPEMLLGDALDVFIAHRCKRLPVVSGHWSPVLLGEVSRHDVLLALQDRMTERPERGNAA